MSNREKHNEFLKKLADLMKEYDAEFDVEYHEYGCECCDGTYEVAIETPGVRSEIYSSYIYPYMVEGEIQ